MTSSDQEQDRSEAATPHKLSEARKQGQVARSADVVAAVVFLAAALLLQLQGTSLLEDQFHFDRMVLARALGADGGASEPLVDLALEALAHSVRLLAPLLITLMLAAILASGAQTGGLFTLTPLQPDWSRLNPIKGFERLMSMRTLFDAARAMAKLLVLVLVMNAALQDLRSHAHAMAAVSPGTFLRQVLADVGAASLKIAVGLLAIASVDLAFTRREFGRKMRMSRRELRDESKHREGDPRIRSRMRELRRQMLKRSLAVRRTGDADLLLTNPTHYAVALSYRHGEMAVPRVVAKGAGSMAATMRDIAHQRGISVVQRPALARALYAQVDVDDELPQAFYRDVAQLMIWVIAMRRPGDATATLADVRQITPPGEART